MNYTIYTKEGNRTRKSGQYEDAVIPLYSSPEVKAYMVNQQDNMQFFYLSEVWQVLGMLCGDWVWQPIHASTGVFWS